MDQSIHDEFFKYTTLDFLFNLFMIKKVFYK